MEEKVEQNGNFGDWRYCGLFEKVARKQKGKEKGGQVYLETYLEGVNVLFPDDCCVVKAKCYCSMRRAEAPHKRRIVFDNCEEGCTAVTTQCSCKARTGNASI